MENRTENPGLNIERGRVDSFKKVIKEKDVFKLEGNDRDLVATGIIGELAINGVNTIEDLFNKTQNGNVNQEVARKNIKDLGTAIAESILESDNEELKVAMVAGSFSTEALLPEPWRGRMESDDGDVGLAGVICESVGGMNNVRQERKEIIIGVMESVDYMKNNGFKYQDQIGDGIIELNKLLRTSLSSGEKRIIAERLKYLNDEKEKISSKNPKEASAQKNNKALNEEETEKKLKIEEILEDEDLTDEEKAREIGLILYKETKNFGKGEKKEMGNTSFDEVLKKLDEIEESGREATDLTINSSKYRFLNEVAIGNYKVIGLPKIRDEKTREFREMEPKELKEMISERIQLNDRFLLASKTKAIEDIVKTMSIIHEGDNDKSLDRNFVGFFLKKEVCGLLPIKEAWRLRQEAYYNYFDMDDQYRDESKGMKAALTKFDHGRGMLVDIAKNRSDLLTERGLDLEKFLDIGIMMHKSDKFGIDKDYYSNLRCDINATRKEIVKEYMIQEIVKRKGCDRKAAEKACELANKLSVATYQDSAANIGLVDADDYAELRLFKFLKYQDGVDTGGLKNPKNKSIGSYDTIKFINTLTPTFLEAVNSKKDNKLWKPLYAEDINTDAIDGKSDMFYHFGSVILKKVLPVKALLTSEQPSKDVLSLNKLRSSGERLNKVISEAGSSGLEVLDIKANKMENLTGTKEQILETKQRKLRFWYIAGLMDLASETRFSEWDTAEEILGLKDLVTGKNFYGPTQEKDQSFISEAQWEWIDTSYNIVNIARNRQRSDERRKRAIFK